MKKFGNTIRLFLIDGEPNGRNANGFTEWRLPNKKTLKEVESEEK